MPKFVELDAAAVSVGRGRGAAIQRQPFIDAVRTADAGRIDLLPGEQAGSVKRRLQEASKIVGKRVRSSFDVDANALYWKRVGA
jgi:hypothetical protein